MGEPFEQEVVRQFLDELDSPAFRAAVEAADDGAERREEILELLRDLDRQSADLGVLWRRKTIDAAGWEAALRDLDQERGRLDAELAEIAFEEPVNVDNIREDWPWATLDEKRWFLMRFLEKVTVSPAVPGRKFDPERIKLRWRHRRERT